MQKKRFYHAARRIFTGLCLAFAVTSANADDFTDLQKAAKGQTVYFNAWGGDAKINSYISWAGQILADRHDITLVHVKLTDTASAVSRILAEKAAGRENGGSIDLLWVNGENFAAMKRAGLCKTIRGSHLCQIGAILTARPCLQSCQILPNRPMAKKARGAGRNWSFPMIAQGWKPRRNQPRHWLIILPQIRVALPFRNHQISLACPFSNRF